MKKKIMMVLVTIGVVLAVGCGEETSNVQDTSQNTVESSMEEQNEEVEEVVQEVDVEETKEEEIASDNMGYMYEIGNGEKTVKFNSPQGFYYDEPNSREGFKSAFNLIDDKITIGYASYYVSRENVLNYLNNGEWNTTYDSGEKEVVEQKEIDTKYGKITLLTIVRENEESDDYKYEYGYFTYNNEEWMISRTTLKDKERSFEEIINEMFTEQLIEQKEKDEAATFEINYEQYDYIVAGNYGNFKFADVVGVNVPESYEFERCREVSVDNNEYICNVYLKNGNEKVNVEVENVGGCLEVFCDTGVYDEGGKIDDFYSIKLLEKKETVETAFGEATIIYGKYAGENVMADGSITNPIGNAEWAVLKVNGYVVIVKYPCNLRRPPVSDALTSGRSAP